MSGKDQGWSSLPSLHLPSFIPPSPLLAPLHVLARVQLGKCQSVSPQETLCTATAEVT